MRAHLAGREDRRIERAAAGIDADPVRHLQPRRLRQFHIGHHADPDHHHVGRHLAFAGFHQQRAAGIAGIAPHALGQHAEPDLDAMPPMQGQRMLAHLGRHRTAEQARGRVDHADPAAEPNRAGRHLQADEAAAEHGHAQARPQGLA